MGEYCFEKWQAFGKGCGAMWPKHGLPHGTWLLVRGSLQNFVKLAGIESRTSPISKAP